MPRTREHAPLARATSRHTRTAHARCGLPTRAQTRAGGENSLAERSGLRLARDAVGGQRALDELAVEFAQIGGGADLLVVLVEETQAR